MIKTATKIAAALPHTPARVKAVAFATTLTAGLVAPMAVGAPAANAWTWSSYVHVAGQTQCGGFSKYSPSQVTIRLDNGEAHIANVSSYGWFGTYGMDFGQVPSGGVGATAWVNCGWLGGTWSRRVTIYRPSLGSQQNLDLRQ